MLMWAAGHANDVPVRDGVATVTTLMDQGASLDFQDNRGRTALMYAAESGRAEIVEALIAAGAGIGIGDNEDKTAKDLARNAAEPEIVALLDAAAQ